MFKLQVAVNYKARGRSSGSRDGAATRMLSQHEQYHSRQDKAQPDRDTDKKKPY